MVLHYIWLRLLLLWFYPVTQDVAFHKRFIYTSQPPPNFSIFKFVLFFFSTKLKVATLDKPRSCSTFIFRLNFFKTFSFVLETTIILITVLSAYTNLLIIEFLN
jgi:hypothetical protein